MTRPSDTAGGRVTPGPVRYPLAGPGVYRTIQGEGALLGVPMVFVRLAGCSVGCPLCDTDYRVVTRDDAGAVVARAGAPGPAAEWVWVTGGEPTDHDLGPLLAGFRRAGWHVALATAGHRRVPEAWSGAIDFLSVSPHDPGRWVQRQGSELKLVPGLNGFTLADFAPAVDSGGLDFRHYFASPLAGDPGSVAECVAFLAARPGWRLTAQAHRLWGLG